MKGARMCQQPPNVGTFPVQTFQEFPLLSCMSLSPWHSQAATKTQVNTSETNYLPQYDVMSEQRFVVYQSTNY